MRLGGSMAKWMLNGFGCLENYAPFDHGLLETRTRNFKTTVKNVKIGLLFLSPLPQKLMKSFNFFFAKVRQLHWLT